MAPRASTRPKIAHVGPDPRRIGGMEAVLRDLLASPLATRYRLYLISSYVTHRPVGRILVFAKALASLARWCRGDGPRLVHVHTAVRGSIYRKSLCVMVATLAGRRVVLQLHAGAGDIDAFAARLDRVRRGLFGAAMRRADVVLSVSRAGADSIEENFGVEGVIVVPNAAPAVHHAPPSTARPRRTAARRTPSFSAGSTIPPRGATCCCAHSRRSSNGVPTCT